MLTPVVIVATLNALSTIFERRIFHCLSTLGSLCKGKFAPFYYIGTDLNDTGTLGATTDQTTIESIDKISDLNEQNFDCLQEEATYKQLVDENIVFSTIQVFTLTIIPLALIVYYNLRILYGVIERQKLLIS